MCVTEPGRRAAGAPARAGGVGPGLLLGGAAVLVYRTVALLSRARTVLAGWVVGLTIVEMVVDVATMVAAARSLTTRAREDGRLALRFGAAATFLHAARVLVFVLGRVGPWRDFDVRPEHRADHRERWTWGGVIFAGAMSALGVLGVGIVWRIRRSATTPGP